MHQSLGCDDASLALRTLSYAVLSCTQCDVTSCVLLRALRYKAEQAMVLYLVVHSAVSQLTNKLVNLLVHNGANSKGLLILLLD